MAIKLTHLGQVVQKMCGPWETAVLVCYASARQWVLVTKILQEVLTAFGPVA